MVLGGPLENGSCTTVLCIAFHQYAEEEDMVFVKGGSLTRKQPTHLPTKFQSVMLSPDSVSLVTPPKITAPTHMPAQPANHHPTARLTVPLLAFIVASPT